MENLLFTPMRTFRAPTVPPTPSPTESSPASLPYTEPMQPADQMPVRIEGAMLSLLGTAEPRILHEWFDKLADGGRIVDPLAKKPWGASDGQVIDRYGLHWLIGYEPTP